MITITWGNLATTQQKEASLSDNSFHVRIFALHSPQAGTYTDFQVLLYSSVVPVWNHDNIADIIVKQLFCLWRKNNPYV